MMPSVTLSQDFLGGSTALSRSSSLRRTSSFDDLSCDFTSAMSRATSSMGVTPTARQPVTMDGITAPRGGENVMVTPPPHRRCRASRSEGPVAVICRVWHLPQAQPEEYLELSHSHRRQATAKHLLRLHSPQVLYLGVAGRRLLRLGRLAITSIWGAMQRIPLLGSLRAQAEGVIWTPISSVS